jgi:hypothetical protein
MDTLTGNSEFKNVLNYSYIPRLCWVMEFIKQENELSFQNVWNKIDPLKWYSKIYMLYFVQYQNSTFWLQNILEWFGALTRGNQFFP